MLGNASSLSDGAAALVLVSRSTAEAMGLAVLGTLEACADAAQDPMLFTDSPSLAMPLALKRAGISVSDVALWEINEAFSVVAVANCKTMELEEDKVNIYGGGVSIGHPIGCSGARIVVTLLNALRERCESGAYGCAGVCNGGGGASALVVKLV